MNLKKLLIIVGAVAVLGAGGWFGWDYFMGDEPQQPAAKKADASKSAAKSVAKAPEKAAEKTAPPAAAVNADKLIDDLMTSSGLKKQLEQLPGQILSGMRQAGQQRKQALPIETAEMEKIVSESFTAQNLQNRAVAQLKSGFDARRAQGLFTDLSSDVAKRMVAMESVQSSQEDLAAFAKGLAAKPLPAPRAELIRRLDAASNASKNTAEIFFSTARALALGAAGDNPQKTVEIDKAIESQRASLTENLRKATLTGLAFTYRNASDADLDAYTKIYESDNGKWFSGIVNAALAEEFKSGATRAGERISALVEEKKKTKVAAKGETKVAAAAPKMQGMSKSEAKFAPAVRPLNPSKKSEDARNCLERTTNPDIVKCAEDYR